MLHFVTILWPCTIGSGILLGFMDNSPTHQLAYSPTRRHTNSPTIKLAKKNTTGQNSQVSPKSL